MYIGELAKRSGVSIKAIRHYEELGLLKAPYRQGKYRVYDESYLPVLAMIKLAKQLGFTLNEIQTIAQAKTQEGQIPLTLLNQQLEIKRASIKAQQKALKQALKDMDQLQHQAEYYNQCMGPLKKES